MRFRGVFWPSPSAPLTNPQVAVGTLCPGAPAQVSGWVSPPAARKERERDRDRQSERKRKREN